MRWSTASMPPAPTAAVAARLVRRKPQAIDLVLALRISERLPQYVNRWHDEQLRQREDYDPCEDRLFDGAHC
jgi:hypothetical protein